MGTVYGLRVTGHGPSESVEGWRESRLYVTALKTKHWTRICCPVYRNNHNTVAHSAALYTIEYHYVLKTHYTSLINTIITGIK